MRAVFQQLHSTMSQELTAFPWRAFRKLPAPDSNTGITKSAICYIGIAKNE
jgi:hypothetical protein